MTTESSSNNLKRFLPFISESSDPLSIYTNLLNRNKDFPEEVFLTVYKVIIKYGINAVRDVVDNMGATLTTAQIINSLYEKYYHERVDLEVLNNCFIPLGNFDVLNFSTSHNQKIKKLSQREVFSYLYAITSAQFKDSSTNYDFSVLEQKGLQVLNNIPDYYKIIKRTDEESYLSFKTALDLKGFILYLFLSHPASSRFIIPVKFIDDDLSIINSTEDKVCFSSTEKARMKENISIIHNILGGVK